MAESKLPRTPASQPLRISQRMKLDVGKLAEVASRIAEAGTLGCAVLLALPETKGAEVVPSEGELQSRPLHHLVDYLRAKQAAGVVFLKDAVLHAFPPCDFSYQLLTRQAHRLEPDYGSDDHLVLLLIRVPPSMASVTTSVPVNGSESADLATVTSGETGT